MNARPSAWQRPETRPAPIDVLIARSEARAYLWINGEFEDIAQAVDPLQDYAFRAGLVRDLGQDCVQTIINGPFERLWRDADEFEGYESYCNTCGTAPCANPSFCAACREADRRLSASRRPKQAEPRPTPQVTIEAIMWCTRERGAAALNEPKNVERFTRCDAPALAEVERRLTKILETADDSRA